MRSIGSLKTWDITVVDRAGQPITQARALLRYVLSWLWFLPAQAYAVLDLAENMAVAALLRAGPEVEVGLVTLASGLTMAKFAAVAVAVVLALGRVWHLWRAR